MVGVDKFIHPTKTETVSTEEGELILELYDFCQDEKDVTEIEAKAKSAEDEAMKALEELDVVKGKLDESLKENSKLKEDHEGLNKTMESVGLENSDLRKEVEELKKKLKK